MKIKNLIVKRLCISYESAHTYIQDNKVTIDEKLADENAKVLKHQRVICDGKIVQEGILFFYIAYYKPRGIECTLNPKIPNNLLKEININEKYFPVGRLDKESEGLLILTNDGVTYNKLLSENYSKEYEVTVDQFITDEMLQTLASGISILGKMTQQCTVNRLSETSFNITLREGMNRQIRRMCYKLGYEVMKLKRIRFGNYWLGDLPLGTHKTIELTELL
jgi:23S rRNA pseudouridine2604 synthase